MQSTTRHRPGVCAIACCKPHAWFVSGQQAGRSCPTCIAWHAALSGWWRREEACTAAERRQQPIADSPVPQIDTYNGDANLTAYPGLPFTLANASYDGTPYQGLLFPANTLPTPGRSLGSYDLIWDRVVTAAGTGAVSLRCRAMQAHHPHVCLPGCALCWLGGSDLY